MNKGKKKQKKTKGRGLLNPAYTGKFFAPRRKYSGCGVVRNVFRGGTRFQAVACLLPQCGFVDTFLLWSLGPSYVLNDAALVGSQTPLLLTGSQCLF